MHWLYFYLLTKITYLSGTKQDITKKFWEDDVLKDFGRM